MIAQRLQWTKSLKWSFRWMSSTIEVSDGETDGMERLTDISYLFFTIHLQDPPLLLNSLFVFYWNDPCEATHRQEVKKPSVDTFRTQQIEQIFIGYKYFIVLKKSMQDGCILDEMAVYGLWSLWSRVEAVKRLALHLLLLDGTLFLPSAHFMSLERREIWAIRRTFWIHLSSFLQLPIQSHFVLICCCKVKRVAGKIVKAVQTAFWKHSANRK